MDFDEFINELFNLHEHEFEHEFEHIKFNQFQHQHEHIHKYEFFNFNFHIKYDHNGVKLSSMWDKEFWNVTWRRPYGRYNRHHQLIWMSVLPYVKGKVLDLGCGPAMLYKDKDIDITGIDWSESAIEQAKLNNPKGTFLVGDVTNTLLPSAEYDTILILGVLDYFDDWTPVLEEARRLVKPGGKIIATLLDSFNGHSWKHYKHLTGNWFVYEE